jgi:hypothetical protein
MAYLTAKYVGKPSIFATPAMVPNKRMPSDGAITGLRRFRRLVIEKFSLPKRLQTLMTDPMK